MARIRTIKPELWTDEKFVKLTAWARLLFIGMWNFVDDEGRIENSPLRLRMLIFPNDKINIETQLHELLDLGLVIAYDVNGKQFLSVPKFRRHQVINKPSSSQIPPPPNGNAVGLPESSGNAHGMLLEYSGSATGGKGKEWKGKEFSTYVGVESTNADDEGVIPGEHQATPGDGPTLPGIIPNSPSSDEIVEHTFGYYLERLHKNPKTYTLTGKRKTMALRRLDDVWNRLREPKGLEAEGLFRELIDALAASDFHNGRDPKHRGKTYNDWDIVFRNLEQFEKWLVKLEERGRVYAERN